MKKTGIVKTVTTTVVCDECFSRIGTWYEVSKYWAKLFAKEEGAYVSDKGRVLCKDCRTKEIIKNCMLIRKLGEPDMPYGKCMGFDKNEKCDKCFANVQFRLNMKTNKKE